MSIDSNPDVLLIQERVQNQLALGESQFREFKSAWEGRPGTKRSRDPKAVAKDIGETLVAFANADGGVLLIGVEDDGTVTGLSCDENGLEVLTRAPVNNVHASTPLPTPVVRKLTIARDFILYFSVEKSTRLVHQTSDGECLQRKDKSPSVRATGAGCHVSMIRSLSTAQLLLTSILSWSGECLITLRRGSRRKSAYNFSDSQTTVQICCMFSVLAARCFNTQWRQPL